MPAEPNKEYFTISVVSNMFDIHPQTLRLYEREGLLCPHRSSGNTRLYSRQDIEHLNTILNLTREMGVNLAGVAVILDLLNKLRQVQQEKQELLDLHEALGNLQRVRLHNSAPRLEAPEGHKYGSTGARIEKS